MDSVKTETEDYQQAKRATFRMLTRREHSAKEVTQKLQAKGFADKLIATIIAELQQQDWQSDCRFCDAYIRARVAKGFGPQRIKCELRARGIGDELVDESIEKVDVDWQALLHQVWQKHQNRFADWQRTSRFLQYRGFDYAEIQGLKKQTS